MYLNFQFIYLARSQSDLNNLGSRKWSQKYLMKPPFFMVPSFWPNNKWAIVFTGAHLKKKTFLIYLASRGEHESAHHN